MDNNLETLRHSCSHIMAAAVKRLYPDVRLGIGPAIENGFYYDFQIPAGLKEEDLAKIEETMRAIVKENLSFTRKEISSNDAKSLFEKNGEKFKAELVTDLNGQIISVYSNGDFIDLCRGPHVASTGEVKYFKLLSISGAYWKGIDTNEQLVRVYGTAFFSQKELDDYIKVLEESKKRDHRTLGRSLDLYSITDTVGAGLVLWHPAGGRLRTIIEDFWRKEHYKNGYELVYSPHIGKADLWETSGHLDFYRENMYAAMEIDNQEYFVKPMNCPFHIMIYKSRQWSYRELPLRWAELGTVYRYEKSGVLHGLLRVRGFTQDDAHLICRPDQMPDEIRRVLRFCLYMLKSFGFENFQICLATKPKEKSVGDQASWDAGTEALKAAVIAEGLAYEIDEGGGAFYGPKIDIKIKDALGRAWQCSTIQFDFNLPERFDMTFSGADNQKQRPYMIHRALLGSLERFMGVLIEHYAGKFPLWLAPVQVLLINIGDDTIDFANTIKEKLIAAGLRVEADLSDETLQKKIRNGETAKIPYMFILGKKEKETGQISLRKQGSKNMGGMSLEDAIKLLVDEANSNTRG